MKPLRLTDMPCVAASAPERKALEFYEPIVCDRGRYRAIEIERYVIGPAARAIRDQLRHGATLSERMEQTGRDVLQPTICRQAVRDIRATLLRSFDIGGSRLTDTHPRQSNSAVHDGAVGARHREMLLVNTLKGRAGSHRH
jgi:hypothetical protein